MANATRKVSLLLMGAGNVGRRLMGLLILKEQRLRDLGLDLSLTGVSDTSGVAVCPSGLNLQQLVALKEEGKGVAEYPQWGQAGVTALEMVLNTEADLLLEAAPANMQDGQPGLHCIEAALSRGMHVVTADRVPLVLAYPQLIELAKSKGVRLQFDATVAGGLPAVNIGRRDLAVAHIHRMEGILNLTTNYILTRMADDGLSYAEALADAQMAGHAETDPTLDVEGWDAANKLVILAQSVLGQPATLDDVAVEGITHITGDVLEAAAGRGKRVKLVATAEETAVGYRLTVRCLELEATHPLAQLRPKQMGIVYHTDISGAIAAAIVEETPVPTASAMLRDVVDIYSS